MKKAAILCSLVFASFSFANTNFTVKNDVRSSNSSTLSVSSSEYLVTLKNGKSIKVNVTEDTTSRRWRVDFMNACGDFMIVFFNSDYIESSDEFINDLANAVNSNYDC